MAITIAEELQREGLAKGRAEGQVKSVFTVIESRFGEIPVGVHKKLMNFRDGSRIEQIIKLAATCQSLKEFQKAL